MLILRTGNTDHLVIWVTGNIDVINILFWQLISTEEEKEEGGGGGERWGGEKEEEVFELAALLILAEKCNDSVYKEFFKSTNPCFPIIAMLSLRRKRV